MVRCVKGMGSDVQLIESVQYYYDTSTHEIPPASGAIASNTSCCVAARSDQTFIIGSPSANRARPPNGSALMLMYTHSARKTLSLEKLIIWVGFLNFYETLGVWLSYGHTLPVVVIEWGPGQTNHGNHTVGVDFGKSLAGLPYPADHCDCRAQPNNTLHSNRSGNFTSMRRGIWPDHRQPRRDHINNWGTSASATLPTDFDGSKREIWTT
ncbi:hypothetical protein BDR05DRAFT_988061 [Suillus weaverae]|nr:hypothetical protein BDR05DRAFT_988061 [Suillus weaverae]